jgi:hypothetical protein
MTITPYQPNDSKRDRLTKSVTPISSKTKHTNKIERLPRESRRLPAHLRSLKAFQQISSVLTFAFVATALGIYARSVYIPRLWSQEYKKLETLQRHERHLTAIGETLKNELAQQAEKPEMGLANFKPDRMVFISPSSVAPISEEPKTIPAENRTLISKTPLAY